MKLWSIQPPEVYEEIITTGYYRCDENKSKLYTTPVFQHFEYAYNWISNRLEDKIMPPPSGTKLPVWAWHTRKGKHQMPDLREIGYGIRGNELYCLEIEVDDDRVLLSDFDKWDDILCNYSFMLLGDYTDEDEKNYIKTWDTIFEIDNSTEMIQATMWEIRKEDIINAIKFQEE